MYGGLAKISSAFCSMERWKRGQNRVKASECAHRRLQQDGVSSYSLLSARSKAQQVKPLHCSHLQHHFTSDQGFSACAVHRNNQETPKSDISLHWTLRDSIAAGLLFSEIPSAGRVAKPLSQTLTHLAQLNTLIGILSTRKQVQTGRPLPWDNR